MNIDKNYRNIILDVGDVLLEYRWKNMMMDHGLTEEESLNLGNLIFENKLWYILDLATMTHDQVVAEYQKLYPEHAEVIGWFLSHGEQMVVYRPDIWKLVHQLKEKGYRIYLLSNYSEDLFRKHTREATFIDDIDGKVVSYEVHVTKPNHKIYQILLDRYQLKPEESIFFDDREDNTRAAEEMGIDAVTVTSKEVLAESLQQLLSKADA